MRIHFERSGGFAGMRIEKSLNTDEMPEDQAKELEDLVNSSGFFGISPSGGPGEGADRFQYKVTIESEGRSHTIESGEGSLPDSLRPLLRRLEVLARS